MKDKRDKNTSSLEALDDDSLDKVMGGLENNTLMQQQKGGYFPDLNDTAKWPWRKADISKKAHGKVVKKPGKNIKIDDVGKK